MFAVCFLKNLFAQSEIAKSEVAQSETAQSELWSAADKTEGVSLVEILIAVALLSVISIAGLQIVSRTETTLVAENKQLVTLQRSEAIAAYIKKDFETGSLQDNLASKAYLNSNMPEDLKTAPPLTVSTVFGNADRFNLIDPKCRLIEDADLNTGTFKFQADCHFDNYGMIAERLNQLLALGVKISVAIDNAGTRCVINQPITVTILSMSVEAVAKVEDPSCLQQGGNTTQPVEAGSHILFPRYVAYASDDPAVFHVSMIEGATKAAAGITLLMPDNHTAFGNPQINTLNFIDAGSDAPVDGIFLALETSMPGSQLSLQGPYLPGVSVNGFGNRLAVSGPSEGVRNALNRLQYTATDDWFGIDNLSATLKSGPLTKTATTSLNVRPNCGGQNNGTAILFEIGTFDPVTGFNATRYITSVTETGIEPPKARYGYCGYIQNTQEYIRYDRADGTATRFPGPLLQTPMVCEEAKNLNTAIPGGTTDNTTPGWPNPFVRYSPRARSQKANAITVFLYEQTTPNTRDSFSLFFNFDTFDDTGGRVHFELNNIEQHRNLDNESDPYVMLDDIGEYKPKIIGSGAARPGTLTAKPIWKKPNDGVVVPLRLPTNGINAATGRYELRHYDHDPDNDSNVNPNLRLFDWEGLNRWSIRATNETGTGVTYRDVFFDNATPAPNTAIQLKIDKSQPCTP